MDYQNVTVRRPSVVNGAGTGNHVDNKMVTDIKTPTQSVLDTGHIGH